MRNSAPLADHSWYTLAISATRTLRNALVRLGFGRRRQCDRRFVVSWTAANIEDEPRIGDLHDHRVTFHENLPIEQRSIELPGAVLIGDDKKMRQNETILRRWEVVLVHAKPLKCSYTHVARTAAWADNFLIQPDTTSATTASHVALRTAASSEWRSCEPS